MRDTKLFLVGLYQGDLRRTVCGVFGYVLSSTNSDARPSLDGAIAALYHRGPDGNGTFVDERADPTCAMAHTRLSLIHI